MVAMRQVSNDPLVPGDERYPVPVNRPVYNSAPQKATDRKRFSVYALLDAACIVVTLVLTFWFTVLLLRDGLSWHPARLVYLLVFFVLLTYLALPRMHQLFTLLYVPDYFIGRTRTSDGLLGDPVNLALDGSADDIHAVMRRAGWTMADDITLRSSVDIVRSSLTGRSYPSAPVSPLFLFGRQQAFAYQQEVDGNAAQRHHIRFWPVPDGWLLPGGHKVQWLAAGTYDRSLGLSAFTLQVTHKIDADIDLERDYVIETVRYADPQCTVEVIEDFSTAYHAKNGGGDAVHTDGDLPILDVAGAHQRAAASGCTDLVPMAPVPRPSRRNRELPPRQLVGAGVLAGLMIVVMALAGLGALLVPDTALEVTGEQATELRIELVAMGLMSLVAGVCLVLTFRHRPWARLLLSILSLVLAITELLSLTRIGQSSGMGAEVISTSLALLLVLGLSSDAARVWVARGSRPAITR